MQYPQIQFYKGSLVRLATGELKQVEDLSSDDFLKSAHENEENIYIDSIVVRDFLEVGHPETAQPTQESSYNQHATIGNGHQSRHPNAPAHRLSTDSASLVTNQSPTVLIKFSLESSRTVVFIEVPVEHPFFVFHRGWSSWNPRMTNEKFGLKCRKLKIGDSCISLTRKPPSLKHQLKSEPQVPMPLMYQSNARQQQQESDQCNMMFSSIKINE